MASDRRSIMSILTLTVTLMLAVLAIWPTQLDAYYTQNTGCHHNGSWYADKSLVPTTEKCLNCQCNKKTLVCRLKVCPEMPMPPPRGCVVVQQKNTCCPYLSCARLDAFYKIPSTRRIIAYLDHYERESIDRVVNENVLQRRSDDTDIDLYVCVKNGTVYKSGSAMSSSNLCSYCYCIGGTEKCVKPKCMLPVDGCKPIFVDSTCCPVRYDCSTKQTGKSSQEVRYRKTSNKHYMRMSQRQQRNRGCTVGQQFFAEGQKMKTDKDRPCDICFCIRGQRKCAPKKCAPALRNCIPVVPKGQCCPSSYDCGSQRDYRRSQNSRQFNLFSLLFGKDDDQEAAEGAHIAVEYPPDRHPEVVDKPKPASHTAAESSGTNLFDTLREGLELIDGNNKQMLKENLDLIGMQPSPTPIPLGLIQRPSTTTEMSFLDLILGPSEPNEKEESSSEEIVAEQKSTTSGLSWVDLLLAPDEDFTTSPTVSDKVDHKTPSRINDLTDFKSSTISIDRLDHTNATESEENLGVLNAEDLDKLFLTTTEETFRTESTTAEDTTQTLPTTLSETTEETKSTEPILYDFPDSTKKPMEETAPSLNTGETLLNPTMNATSVSPTKVHNVSQHKVEGHPLEHKKVPNVQNAKPEKRPDFFSALLDGLSDILQVDNKTKNPSNTANVQTTKSPNGKVNITETLSLPTPKPLPHFKPLPTDKTYTRINSKIANLTVKMPIVSTKDMANVTFKPLAPNLSQNPIIPISEELLQSTTIKTTTTMSTTPTPTNISITTVKPTDVTTTLKAVVIKTNPTILEAELYDQKTLPTLPPSLPNLKIIPFLPTDAVKAAQFDFYHHSDPTSRVDYDLYDDANIYPSITEKYPVYPDLEDGSKAEYIYKFNVEGPDASIASTAGKFDGTLGSPAFVKYDFTGSGSQKPKGFSPPTKTEGGFVPKDPLMQDDDGDNVSVKVGDSYQVTQHIIDITTAANMLNTTKVIEITTPDPFKDVIHTEPPPDLTSLIEDKLKKSSISQTITGTNASSHENPYNHLNEQGSVALATNDSYPTMTTNDVQTQSKELGSLKDETTALNDSQKKLTKEDASPMYASSQYVMSNATHEVKDSAGETIESHDDDFEQTYVVSTIPPFKSLPEAVIEQLGKEDSVLTTIQTFAAKTMLPTTTSRAMPRTSARIPIPLSMAEINTTNKPSLVTTSQRPAMIWHNNRNKTIANTTASKTIPSKYGPQQQNQQQQQQQLPLAFTKNKQAGHADMLGTWTNGTKVLSSTSSLKTKGNGTQRIANSKPTKHNTRSTSRPLFQASSASAHMSNGPTTTSATKEFATKANATIAERISDGDLKRMSNKPTKTTSPTKKANAKVPTTTTTTTMATTAAATATRATLPNKRITKPAMLSSSTSWPTTPTTTATTTTTTTTTTPPTSTASIPKSSSSAISTTQNPFLMSPFDKLPFMDASFEVKRNSATPSFSASMPAGQTPSAAITSAALAYTSPSFSTSPAYSSANHPKLMGLVHYKHTLNQLEGLEHSSLGTAQPFAAHSPSNDFIEVSTSSSLYPGNGKAKGPQAQAQHHPPHQQHQLSSQLNNLIDPTGILKLAGCNIYGRMYRVGRIILELSTPCMECKCTEIGVKCGPLDC